jgi:hypothetical protein
MKKFLFSVAAMATMMFTANAGENHILFDVETVDAVSGGITSYTENGVTYPIVTNGKATSVTATSNFDNDPAPADATVGRLNLGGSGAYITLNNVEIGSTIKIYWAISGAASLDKPRGFDIAGATPDALRSTSAVKNIATAETLTATESTVTLAAFGGGVYIYDIYYTSTTSGIGDITANGCEVTGYFNLLGQQLNDAPAKGAYIETYSNCPAKKFVK